MEILKIFTLNVFIPQRRNWNSDRGLNEKEIKHT